MAQEVSPCSGTEAVDPLLVGSKVGCFPGSSGHVGGVQFLPKLSGTGEGVGSQKGSGGQDGQSLVGDRQTGPCYLVLDVFQKEDVLGDVWCTLLVLAHLDCEQYHIQCM